jgi:hypothetical protein
MKSSHSLTITIFLIISFSTIFITSSLAKKNNLKLFRENNTPKASDLKNHYGAPNSEILYGPNTDDIAQYVEANPDSFTPLKTKGQKKIEKQLEFKPNPGVSYKNKLNPSVVKSGEMSNIAPSASKIVTPEIATPKLNIKTEVVYPAVVGLPTFQGIRNELHPVTAYNKETGEIVHDKVVINRPVYKLEKQVMNVVHTNEQSIDLKTNTRIEKNEEKTLHGGDSKK